MTENKYFGGADLAMIATCLLWGLGAVVVKNAIGDTPETFRIFVFNGLRMPVVSLMLFTAARISGEKIGLSREHIPLIALISFFGMFLHIVTSLIGLSLSSASNMGIIFATVPLFILLVSFVTGTEKLTKRLVLGVLIGMTGMVALTYQDGAIRLNPGDILIFASCLFWAVYTVYGKKIVKRYAPLVAIAWVFLFSSVYQFPLFIIQLKDQSWDTISVANWINLGIGTIGSYSIANTLYFYAIKKIGAIRVGIYNSLTPVFTVFLAYLLRGEEITLLKTVGLVVIILGIGITKIPFTRFQREGITGKVM